MSHSLTTLDAPSVPTLADQPIVVDELVFADGSRFGHYNLAHIRISRTNRKRFNLQKLNELAASIRVKGLAQPILIRPVKPTKGEPQTYEIVAGERRFRACIIAGLTSIAAFVRVLSDVEALELQILENLQRDNPHPLEEAEGYERLMMAHGYTADQLAETLDKSRSYIYGRLKLCALNLEVRDIFLDNEDVFPASTALLIARIPLPALQTKAAREILHPTGKQDDEPMSFRKAKDWLQKNYMLDLGKAVFQLKDAKLLRAAGSCNACPKRAGNQPEVFEGIDANVCTDPDCYKEKTARHYDQMVEIALKNKLPVHEGEAASKLYGEIYRAGSALVAADTPLYTFERVAPKTRMEGDVARYIKKEARPTAVALVKGGNGIAEELYDRGAIQALLEAVGACEPAEVRAARQANEVADLKRGIESKQPATKSQQKAAAERDYRAQEDDAKAATNARVDLYKALRQSQTGFTLTMVREVAKYLVRDEHNGYCLPDDLIGDLYAFDGSSDKALCEYIDQAEFGQVELIIMDLVFGEQLHIHPSDMNSGPTLGQQVIDTMARAEKIDIADSLSEQADQQSAEAEQPVQPESAPPGRGTLKLKSKPATAAEPSQGPVIRVKQNRAASIQPPAVAWPYPSGVKP